MINHEMSHCEHFDTALINLFERNGIGPQLESLSQNEGRYLVSPVALFLIRRTLLEQLRKSPQEGTQLFFNNFLAHYQARLSRG